MTNVVKLFDDSEEVDGVFIRMYVSAIKSGLLADMGARRWTTLCVLASYMNEEGKCYPTQSIIAKDLGVSRQTANKYINDLISYRWKGEKVVLAEKIRSDSGQWDNTQYEINPNSGLIIFNHVKER